MTMTAVQVFAFPTLRLMVMVMVTLMIMTLMTCLNDSVFAFLLSLVVKVSL
jgi:hypothetical protein